MSTFYLLCTLETSTSVLSDTQGIRAMPGGFSKPLTSMSYQTLSKAPALACLAIMIPLKQACEEL